MNIILRLVLGCRINFKNSEPLHNLNGKFGGGILLFKNKDKQNLVSCDAGKWVFTEMLSFGVGYKFGKKVKN